jgi:hypothetical protein
MRFFLGPVAGFAFSASAVLMGAAGCQTYQDDLARSQRAFEQNEHEHALAIMRQLEPDTFHLSEQEQAQYNYLRGMTDYRIGYKVDARHWLALAKAMDQKTPGLLPEDWKGRMNEALVELNQGVYGGGLQSLGNAKKKPGDAEDSAKPAKPVKSEDEP